MKISSYKKFYFIGIKGVGMTMLAQFLASQGKRVSGSDIADVFMTDAVLAKSGIYVYQEFSEKNIPQDALVIYSSAYSPDNNVELSYIKKNKKIFKKPLLSYAEALSSFFNQHKGIAVCGSHGKTTVSAWLGFVLSRAGMSPKVLVGARVLQFKGSSLSGSSDYFVAETDEYQNKLKYFSPYGVVLNNIDFDHPDYFSGPKAYSKVFSDFVAKIPKKGFLVANVGDKETRKLVSKSKGKVFSYALADKLEGYKGELSLFAHDLRQKGEWQYFKVNDLGEFKIGLLGAHNVENALAVLSAGLALGLDPCSLKSALAAFKGTARRAEKLGVYKGAMIFDDYAHHPSEIKATLNAFKNRFSKQRLIVLFHPHTFTRTKALFKDFLESFSQADVLGVLEIYGSAREVQGGVSSKDLVSALRKKEKFQSLHYLKDFQSAEAWLRKIIKKGDVLLLLGAGDVFRVGESLLKKRK